MINTQSGVSVVICCHNSATRLPQTLQHLKNQCLSKYIPWEIIIIDNASTDGTADLARKSWPNDSPVKVKVVNESKLGLSFARQRGFKEAQYELVSFVDDDNWVDSSWVTTVYNVMMERPNAGACGGKSEAICEIHPPPWFERFKSVYAVGAQAIASGDVTWSRGHLWGAGLTIRKSAWEFMATNGFKPILTDRLGNRLMAGGDSELCLALRLAGWKLWYDDRLIFQHYLPAQRLSWSYLKKLVRGFGASSVLIFPYHLALVKDLETLKGRTGRIWLWKLRSQLENLVQLESKRFLKYSSKDQGQELEREKIVGSLQELLRIRGMLDAYVYVVYNARWNVIRTQQKKNYALPELA